MKNVEKFKNFLESLNCPDKLLMGTVIRGFDCIYKPEDSGNPYALTNDFDKPDPFYNVQKDRIQQFLIGTDEQEARIKRNAKRFKVDPENLKEKYLLYHENLTLDQFLDSVDGWTFWEDKTYYDDEKHKYFAKIPKKHATIGDVGYQNHGSSRGDF